MKRFPFHKRHSKSSHCAKTLLYNRLPNYIETFQKWIKTMCVELITHKRSRYGRNLHNAPKLQDYKMMLNYLISIS